MAVVYYVLLVFTLLSTIIGSPLLVEYKTWLWNTPCLKANAQSMVPLLADGIRELGTEPLDTMYVDGFHIELDGLLHDWRNIYLHGLKNTIIDDISVDTNSQVIRLVMHTDLSMEANYVSEGCLFCLPFDGAGRVAFQCFNVYMEFIVPYEIVKDACGRDIMNLLGYGYNYDIADYMTMYFDNLYYGNVEDSLTMHLILQQNWKFLTLKYATYLFDKSNDKIFNAVRTLLRSMPLESISEYKIICA